jgi:DNA-directed RNA polymerase specialized sigma24 family protein/LysM repeat protein
MFGEHPEISPDLEWILLSGQANREMLLETLIQDYGVFIYRLAYAALLDPERAEQALILICLRALNKSSSFKPEAGVEKWLLNVSLPVIRKHIRKRGAQHETLSFQEDKIEKILVNLDWKTRLALYLQTQNDFEIDHLAAELKIRCERLNNQIQDAYQAIKQNIPAGSPADAIDEQLAFAWNISEPDSTKLHTCLIACREKLKSKPTGFLITTRLKETLAISAAIVLILVGTWLYSTLNPDPNQNIVAHTQSTLDPKAVIQQITEPLEYTLLPGENLEDIAQRLNVSKEHLLSINQLPDDVQLTAGQTILVNLGINGGQSYSEEENPSGTREMQASSVEAPADQTSRRFDGAVDKLTPSSSIDELIARWQISQNLWTSLFIQGQWVDYGPENYRGPVRSQRFQAWIQQPGFSYQKIGPVDAVAQEIHLISSGLHLTNQAGKEKQLAWWEGHSLPLIASDPLTTLLSPFEFSQSIDRQSLAITGTKKTANRSTISLEALSMDRSRLYRFEIDAFSGILMALQVHTSDGSLRLAEIIVTQIELDPNFDESNLFDPLRMENAAFSQDYRYPFPEGNQISASMEAILSLEPRPVEDFISAPPGFDPSGSRIIFQYPQLFGSHSGNAPTAQIIADGYLLGQVNLQPFWQITCRRSEPGSILAFIERGSVNNHRFAGFSWLSLFEADKLYQAMTDFEVYDLAFRPDGKKLAVIARPMNSSETGLYIFDHVTGTYQFLMNLEKANRLQWKPDGQYISLLGILPDETEPSWMIVHIDSGLVSYRAAIEAGPWEIDPTNLLPNYFLSPPDYPAWQWGLNLAVTRNNLENCAFPER